MAKAPILLTDAIVPPPTLIRAGLEALPAIIRARGERASRRLIEILYRQNRPETTKLYDRTREELTFEEVERIKI
jgi:hypothetical protein